MISDLSLVIQFNIQWRYLNVYFQTELIGKHLCAKNFSVVTEFSAGAEKFFLQKNWSQYLISKFFL